MKLKTRYLAKRIFALALAIALLWSDASFTSLAQTLTQEAEEPSGALLTEPGEEGDSTPGDENPAETPEDITPSETPVETPDETPSESPEEIPEASPLETPEENPEDNPLENPSETPLASPDGELLPSATPLQDSVEIVSESAEGFERFTFRVNDPRGDDWNEDSAPITASDVIFIWDNTNNKVLDKDDSDAKTITWTAQAENGEIEAYECGDGGTLDLSRQFFPFEFSLHVEIELNDKSKYEMWLGYIQPDETTKGKGTLDGLTLPGMALCLKNAEGTVEPYNCFFFRADDAAGTTNVQYIEGGNLFYDIRDEDIGKYIFARYGVLTENGEERQKMDCYQTAVVGPVGYGKGEAAARSNGELFKQHIEELTKISKEANCVMLLDISDGLYGEPIYIDMNSSEPVTISDRICLEAWGAQFTGGFKTKKDMGGAVVINGLTIKKTGGTVIDASDAPAVFNHCEFSLDNANMLQVSKDTFGKTELNDDCYAIFNNGGSLLKFAGAGVQGEFSLGNTDFRIKVNSGTVTMLDGTADVKWNVESLRPEDVDTLKLLSAENSSGVINVINNAFWIVGRDGQISNSEVLTMKSVYNKWISAYTAEGGVLSKIIVSPGTSEEYEVTSFLEEDQPVFRPYAVTGQYGAGAGSYSKLLPAGYLTYVVIDTTQKGGFPYGAQIGKKLTLSGTDGNFVIMQYHADKSVETVASVTAGSPAIKGNSVLANIGGGNGEYQILVNTKINDEHVEEPIVLAVYSALPAAQNKFAVYEIEGTEEETEEVLSDGKILTSENKTVKLELNGGIAKNYYDGDVFTVNTDNCSIKNITVTPTFENDNEATLEIPEGAYGTLTLTAHYKSSQTAAVTDATYTLQLTSVQNIKGTDIDTIYVGRKYYGTAEFDIRSGEAKPYIGVKASNGGYNLKITSTVLSGSHVTVQYMLDLRGNYPWDDHDNPPALLVETTAGVWGVELVSKGAQYTVDRTEEEGVCYLFDEVDGKVVYTGAVITNSRFYKEDGTQLDIPESVETEGGALSVTAMAKGCLNNIYENGVRANAPGIVKIPKNVTDIKGPLVTDKNYSDLWQIVVDDNNAAYCTYGNASDFNPKEDAAQYCALYKKNESTTELVEIASNYRGDLAWRSDAQWTAASDELDFSGIYGFQCDKGDDYESWQWDRMLVKDGVIIKAPGGMDGTVLILPEGITGMKARALKGVAITTLVLPSTMTEWDAGAVTQAKNIYVYNPDTTINPVSGLDSSLTGITFYGFVDKDQNSKLKEWVTASPKGQGYKFVAMTENSDSANDYTIRTLRQSSVSNGKEYYEVWLGEELSETFDFDITSKMVNGYPGKTDLYVVWGEGNSDFNLEQGEFTEEWKEDGRRVYRAVNPGVTKVEIKKGDKTVKEVYFAVRPNYFEIKAEEGDYLQEEGYLKLPLGKTQKIAAKAYAWNDETNRDEEYILSEDVLKEYEKLGVLRSVTPDERNVNGTDAWKVEREGFAYNVTPLLKKESNGSIKGCEGSDFTLELFGEKRSIWIETGTEMNGDLVPDTGGMWHSVLEKGNEAEIPLALMTVDESYNEMTERLDYSIKFDGDDTEYQQVFCEVISGSQSVDAEIINEGGKASLKITAKTGARADGKAQIRVYMPYGMEWREMVLTAAVGTDMIGSFSLTLFNDNVLYSSVDPEEINYYFLDINDKDEDGNPAWKHVIPVYDILDCSKDGSPELSPDKLTWTVSDSALAELVKSGNKVTGIRLKGEGTVLVSATVKDTNGASIRMLFTIVDGKPRLYNNSASLDIFKKQSTAEYDFAVPDGIRVTDATLKSAKLKVNKADVDVTDSLEVALNEDGYGVSVKVKDGKELSTTGACTLIFDIDTVWVEYGDDGNETGTSLCLENSPYTVTLQLSGSAPKAAVSAADAMDLSIPSKRESALTVKLGDTVNSADIALDTSSDATTIDFARYFTLEKKEGADVYTVALTNANGKTPADIAKLFNNKKIKLTVTSSEDYRSYTKAAEVTFKMSATAPALKPAGSGKVTVNTADVTAYDGENYASKLSYTLTEGFTLFNDDSNAGDGPIEMTIADKQKAYAEQFTFRKEDDAIVVMAAPGVPKGTYTFTWEPKVSSVEGDSIYTEGQPLKAQKITVTVSASSAKVSLSSSKLKFDRNYTYVFPSANLQFDESQIRMLYGSNYWWNDYDYEKINASVTLLKPPKGVTAEEAKQHIAVMSFENQIMVLCGGNDEAPVPVGEYQYSFTPYIKIGTHTEEGDQEISMALAPTTFSVQVTDTLPTASLTQSTITLDNNDMSARVYTNWNIKGNYEWIEWVSDEDAAANGYVKCSQDNAPLVSLQGNEICVRADENTLKGTYQFEIAPLVRLYTAYDVTDNDGNHPSDTVPLKPVKLTVKVNSTRPTLKLARTSLTAYSSYPGGEYGDGEEPGYYAPAEAGTDINTSNGYGIGSIEVVPADAKTQAIQDNSDTEITFSEGYYDSEEPIIRCFDAIPTAKTPAGDYNYLVYARLYTDNVESQGIALEPVKLKVTVKDKKPTLKLSATDILLPAGRQGCANITLQGQTECVSGVTPKTEYLVKENEVWKLTETETDGAYAVLETTDRGDIIVTSFEAAKAEKVTVSYEQEVTLRGNDTPYKTGYTLKFTFKSDVPAAVVSAKSITVNTNYSVWEQEGSRIKLSLNTGEEIVNYDIVDKNTGNKKDAIGLEEERRDGYEIVLRAFFKRSPAELANGDYKFNIIPFVTGEDGNQKELKAVEVTVKITNATPTVSASQTKVTINKLDTRGNTYQTIHFTPNLPYADVGYKVEVTKGPKGVNLSEIDFFPEGWDLHNEAWLTLASTDTEIPDGAYTVTVTPYTWKADGSRVNLKSISITVTVNSPKIAAALRTPKMTVDVTAANEVKMRNSIQLTGTNADLVERIYWKDVKLTQKPKGAEDYEVWIDDLWGYEDEEGNWIENDGKEFSVCWGSYNDDGPRPVDVTPGTYEFTLTPAGIQSCDGVDLNTPGPLKLTVTIKSTVPTVKYSKTGSKLNALFTNEDYIYYTLSDTSWYLTDVDAVMTSWPKGAGEEKDALRIDYVGDRLKVWSTDKVPEGTYTFLLEPRVEKNGMEVSLKEQKYTVTIKNEIPTVKAASSKLTCNALYSGSYWFEGNPEDNFNKKQQTKLTLSKNYGPSRFEEPEIVFTGKDALKSEADKIDWCFYWDEGIIAANLQWGSVAAAGSYPFEITPVIRSDDTGAQITLKPVKLTVVVENKALTASAKASGKIDLLSRAESGITYKVTLSDKDVDEVSEIYLTGPEKGNNESWKFECEMTENPAECIIRAKDGEELSTKVRYDMRLEVHTRCHKTYYVPVTIQPTQSKLSLTTDVKSVTLFKQSSYDTAAEVQITASINNTEAGKMQIIDDQNEVWTGNSDFFAEVIYDENDEELNNKELKIKILFTTEAAKAKYKAGSQIKALPVYVRVYNQASDTYSTTKVDIAVTIKN